MKERKHDEKQQGGEQQNNEYDVRRWEPTPYPITERLGEPRRSNDYGHLIVRPWDNDYDRKPES